MDMRQVVSNNPDIQQMQSALNDQFAQLSKVAILKGVQLTGVNLTGAGVPVQHKLGRKPQGYFVTSLSASATVWNGTFTDTVVPLYSSVACTVDLWVY